MPNITHILASPMRRTMATALHAFAPVIAQGLKLVAYPDLRESGCGKASTGSSVEALQKIYPEEEQLADLRLVPHDWEYNKEDSNCENRARASRVRRNLWELSQAALKEHGGIWRGHDVSRGLTHKNIAIVIVTHAASCNICWVFVLVSSALGNSKHFEAG
jgi:broad specificity phosphatase PhoE